MSIHRFKFSRGTFSCEIEGTPEFIEQKLDVLLEKALEISDADGAENQTVESKIIPSSSNHNITYDESFSTNTIALATNVKTGSDLVIAAITHLQLVRKLQKVTRQDISEEIKSATSFYKTTYSSNLTAYLDTLTKSRRLNLVAKDTYSLSSSERQSASEAIQRI